MTWFKVDDSLPTHRKVLAIPRGTRRLAAVGAWALGGAWCSGNLTEGRIPKAALADIGIGATQAADLVRAGLWLEEPEHFVFHDFHDYNPTKEQEGARKAAAADRQRRARERARETRESRETSRVTSRMSHAGSHGPPDPTRPDPKGRVVVGEEEDVDVEVRADLAGNVNVEELPPPEHDDPSESAAARAAIARAVAAWGMTDDQAAS